MSVILLLILASLGLALTFLAGFIWAVRSGQFEDTFTPSLRVLSEDGTSNATPDPRSPRQPIDRQEQRDAPSPASRPTFAKPNHN